MDNVVEEIGQFSKIIQDYGPMIVILAVFLLLFLVIILYLLQSHKKTIETERAMNGKLVESILNNYFAENPKFIEEKSKKNYDEKNIVDIFVKLNRALKNVCESTSKKTNSDRTAIYVFHNGTQASHGLPFFKLSCICEWVSKGSNTNMIMSEHSALPLNLFDNIIDNLYENSEYIINIETTKDSGDILFLKSTKIKQCFFIPIYDDENNMMGFVFNGYNTIDPNINIDQEKEYLIDLAIMAKPVIEFSKLQDYQSREKE